MGGWGRRGGRRCGGSDERRQDEMNFEFGGRRGAQQERFGGEHEQPGHEQRQHTAFHVGQRRAEGGGRREQRPIQAAEEAKGTGQEAEPFHHERELRVEQAEL